MIARYSAAVTRSRETLLRVLIMTAKGGIVQIPMGYHSWLFLKVDHVWTLTVDMIDELVRSPPHLTGEAVQATSML